jgi:hypothetical protein
MSMQGNPYDELFRHLARMMEEMAKKLPDQDAPRIIGCTIITTGGEVPSEMQGGEESGEISYEIVEGKDRIYITAVIPATVRNAPTADIRTQEVRILADESETVVPLASSIDVKHSFYHVRRGVMDIVCYKA